jgi:hypothetical protein
LATLLASQPWEFWAMTAVATFALFLGGLKTAQLKKAKKRNAELEKKLQELEEEDDPAVVFTLLPEFSKVNGCSIHG